MTELSPWAAMHTAIGLGVDTQVVVRRQRVNAIGWLCWNGTCRDWQLFEVGKRGLEPLVGPGVQGHSGQFLSVLAFARVPRDYELRTRGPAIHGSGSCGVRKAHFYAGFRVDFQVDRFGALPCVGRTVVRRTWGRVGHSWLIREELTQPVNDRV